MLVLSRRPGERLRLRTAAGEEVWVSVQELGLDRVRLGIAAPLSVEVMREELLEDQDGDDN